MNSASPAAVIANALRWEWYRLRRRAAFWVIIGLVAAGAAIQLAAQTLLARLEAFPAAAYDYPGWVMTVAGETMPLIAVALSAMAFGSDVGGGTMRALVARGMPRWQAALGKLLMISATLIALLAAIWILAALFGLLAAPWANPTAANFGSANPAAANPAFAEIAAAGWGDSAAALLRVAAVLLAYIGLGSVLAAAGRSTAFGIGVGIAIIIAESVAYPTAGAVAGVAWGFDLDDYTRWTLGGAASALTRGTAGASPWALAAVTLAYAALCWTLTLALLTRRDLGSGGH